MVGNQKVEFLEMGKGVRRQEEKVAVGRKGHRKWLRYVYVPILQNICKHYVSQIYNDFSKNFFKKSNFLFPWLPRTSVQVNRNSKAACRTGNI